MRNVTRISPVQRHPPFTRRGEQAIQEFQRAALADAMPRTEVGDDIVYGAARPDLRAGGPSYT